MIFDKKNSKYSGYVISAVLTVAFLYFAFRGIDLRKAFGLIADTSYFWLAIYILIFVLSHYVRALRWKIMIQPIKHNASSLNIFGAVMVGYGVNCVLPRLGELYRGLFLGKWEKISRSTMLGSIVVERVIDIAAFGIASILSVYFYSGDLYTKIPWLRPALSIGFVFIVVAVLLLYALVKFQSSFSDKLFKFLDRMSPEFKHKIDEGFQTLIEGFATIKGKKNIIKIIGFTVLMFYLYALNTLVGFYMLGMESYSIVDFKMAWVFMAISAFGTLVPTPGGTGSYHMVSIFVLTQLYNFDFEISAAYAILTHFIQYVVFIGGTALILFLINQLRKQRGEPKENFVSVFKSNHE
ncbi:lysylphosphatidylglycerol synthase transmembrane domain-containing protein [Melioribacter sp. OK-6-Me]|uniref:lysylphosphatidylglycerol synthase transmembrane domain-containing protein n=1 Tax=unclassified Melioribacter TaxID=2627329 RepID=UPI003ED94DB9